MFRLLHLFFYYLCNTFFIEVFLLLEFERLQYSISCNQHEFIQLFHISFIYFLWCVHTRALYFCRSRSYRGIYARMMPLHRFFKAVTSNQWNTQIISIFFLSASRFISRRDRAPRASKAIPAILMVCIIHIDEPNRIEIRGPPMSIVPLRPNPDRPDIPPRRSYKKFSLPYARTRHGKTFIATETQFPAYRKRICTSMSILIINHSRDHSLLPPPGRIFSITRNQFRMYKKYDRYTNGKHVPRRESIEAL